MLNAHESTKEINNDEAEISVVIPCYNAETLINRSVSSVLDQTGVATEVIVIDDGSTDRSLEVVKEFKNGNVIWETGPNRGGPSARNRGLELANQEFIMFLDADDYLEDGFLRGLVDAARDHNSKFSIGPCATSSANRRIRPKPLPRTTSEKDFLTDWITGSWLPPAAICWRTAFVREIGGWRTDIRRNQDGELIYRAVLNNALPAVSQNGRAIYWQHQSATRINNVVSRSAVESSFEVFQELANRLQEKYPNDREVLFALSYASHSIERYAAQHRLSEIEADIRRFREEHHFPKFHGSTLHAMGASILGLGRKERLLLKMRETRRVIKNLLFN